MDQIRGCLVKLDARKELDGAPAARFLDGTTVTLSSIMNLLNDCFKVFSHKVWMWQGSYAVGNQKHASLLWKFADLVQFPADLPQTETTMRTLPEILMQAILISKRSWSTVSNETIGHWLGSLKDLPPAEPIQTPLQTGFHRLSSVAWKAIYRLKPERTNLGVGSVACVCALWTGKTLFTGSTLYKWGDALSKAEILSGAQQPGVSDLQGWARDLRQARFTIDEQGLLNALVERAVRNYHDRMAKLLGRTEETMRSRIKGLQDNSERVQLMHQLASAKETAMKDLQAHWRHNLPSSINETFSREGSPILGMAYEGQRFGLKRKCPICSAIYIFPVARSKMVEALEQDWQVVGEADPNCTGRRRGCYTEAIVFVRCLTDLGILDICRRQADS
ncbi:MAG: hypothetical protein Q9191_005916 [Dirinaria sp. TL-2023a]